MGEVDPRGQVNVGTVLNDTYQITGLIGRGGVGAVFSASHLRLPGKRVAIKVIHTGSLGDEVYVRFRREAEVATRIGHPNIVEVLDWNTLPGGTPYMVLELLQGESLAARLARTRLSLESTLSIVAQIGSALAAAHRAGVVHRDLKPDNIFLCPTDIGGTVIDRVKVLDFGISKIKNSLTVQTQEAHLIGTPQYMSPEQASGKNALVDHRTDLFALGTIVYEMLSGRCPFSGESLVSAVFQVVYEQPPPLASIVPNLPPNVVAAVEKAMAKEPDKRYQDAATLVAELTGRPLDLSTHAAPAGVHIDALATTEASKLPAGSLLAAGTPRGQQPVPRSGAPESLAPTFPASVPGPRPPGTPAPAPVAPTMNVTKKGRGALYAILGLIVVAGGGIGIWRATATPGTTGAAGVPLAAPGASGAGTPPVAVASVNPPASAPAATPPSPPAPATQVVEQPTPPPPPTPPAPHPKPAVPPPAPDEHTTIPDLVDAEAAMSHHDFAQALRLARHSLQERKTAEAFIVMTKAYCGLKDLSNAKATLQQLGAGARSRTLRDCRNLGFPLDD